MSTTTATTSSLSITFFPPPTSNSLAPAERTRLLRSTRKLEALLGATPFLLDAADSPLPSTPIPTSASPPKTAHRDARLYNHSPSPSVSSLHADEPDYVVVPSTTRSAAYQPVPSPLPAPARSDSLRASGESRPKKRRVAGPVALVFDVTGSSHTRTGSGSGSAGQPLLLRLAPASISTGKGDSTVTTNSPTTTTTTGRVRPASVALSPVSAVFNAQTHAYAHLPASPTTPTPQESGAMHDRERRRKMAKLARTLGENVPPELVFRAAPPPVRRASLFASPFSKKGPAYAPPPLPLLAGAAAPSAPATPALVLAPASSPPPTPKTARRPRPRSLTLASSAIASASAALARSHHPQQAQAQAHQIQPRGTASLDSPLSARPFVYPGEAEASAAAAAAAAEEEEAKKAAEFGRRKEREWSGEWNVKDMEDVARRLRGLKGR